MPIAVIDILATGTVAIAATVVGAWLQRHFARAARQEVIEQDAAAELDQQLHRLHAAVVRDHKSSDYARLHTQYEDDVAGLVWRLGDAEVVRRVRLVGQLLVLGHTAPQDDPFPPYAILHAIDDARASAIAVMRQQEMPAATFPTYETVLELSRGPVQHRYEELEQWMADHPAPSP